MTSGQAGERTFLVCSCETTMPLHDETVRRGCGGRVQTAEQLCRKQLDLFQAVLGQSRDVVVGCTQEQALFTETAEDLGYQGRLTFANVRETAGWSTQAAHAGAKTAALLAAAREDMPPIQLVTLESKGVALLYGRDDLAIELGRRLADVLDITVLLTRPGEVQPARTTDFPVVKGTIGTARGVMGTFELAISDYALPLPSSRMAYRWQAPRDGATSTCDLIIDVSGGAPLFPAPELRPGYLRADPGDRGAVERLISEARGLVGTFDKPRYIDFHGELCAHSRSKITGCTRCLDLCPTGAISPAGDTVAIDPAVCAGCGACAAACPTGAASYALPPADAVMRRLRTLLATYRSAGGRDAIVLFHDAPHGEPLIDALARFGDGLSANVLPLGVNEVTQIGPEVLTSAIAMGAAGVRLLTRARPKHDVAGLMQVVSTANAIAEGLGYGADLARVISTDDPDGLAAALSQPHGATVTARPSDFLPMGAKRGVLEQAMREIHRAAPVPVDRIMLEKGAPFGVAEVDTQACTLCLACVSACPTGALGDNPEQPMLRFTESLCVQCGLCEQTCPEDAISLQARIDFPAWAEPRRIVKQEEPFCCTACGKPFGTKSTVERIAAKLEGHWMYSGVNAHRRDNLFMCESCRTERVVNESFDPYGAPQRPRVRTSEDYLRERAEGKDDLT